MDARAHLQRVDGRSAVDERAGRGDLRGARALEEGGDGEGLRVAGVIVDMMLGEERTQVKPRSECNLHVIRDEANQRARVESH